MAWLRCVALLLACLASPAHAGGVGASASREVQIHRHGTVCPPRNLGTTLANIAGSGAAFLAVVWMARRRDRRAPPHPGGSGGGNRADPGPS